MKLHSLSLIPVSGLLIVLATGCASDPNKQVQSAEANLTSEQQQAQVDQAQLDRKQAAEHAGKDAELTRKQESAQATTRADGTMNVAEAKKDLTEAQANMTQDRRDFDAKVQERIEKADAKEKELSVKSKKLDAKKTTAFKSNRARFTELRSEVGTKARAIKSTNDDAWASTKKDLEKQLDDLEFALDQMGKGL